MTWNLYHGRDAPPDRSLETWRSRLTGKPVRGKMFTQVNEELFPYFAELIAEARWDVALLQECPPRWTRPLAEICGVEAASTLTSRNSFTRMRGWVARHNPDLIGSNEGGSNLTLIRPAAGRVAMTRELQLRAEPERRAMGFAETTEGFCVANLHLTNDQPALAAEELVLAARRADRWAGGRPLIFGGDLNLRPGEDAGHPVFKRLAGEHGLRGATGPGFIDHLLSTLEVADGPRAWAAAERDVEHPAGLVRLSDHAPVEAAFRAPD